MMDGWMEWNDSDTVLPICISIFFTLQTTVEFCFCLPTSEFLVRFLFAKLRYSNMERSSAPMFAIWKVKREAGKWKRSCRLSGATTASRCWGASSSQQGAVHQETTAEMLPVTCCTDMTPAIISGPGYASKEHAVFFVTVFSFKMRMYRT